MTSSVPAAFLSYSREDSAFALRLAGELKTAGIPVWLDQLAIKPGQRWDGAVGVALTEAQQVIVVLSPASVKSDNVLDEISFGLDHGKTIIPVLYKDCVKPVRIQRIQHIDFRTNHAAGMATLLSHLNVQPADGEPSQVARKRQWNPSRRKFIVGSAALGCAVAGGIAWKWDELYNTFHPLPSKRFVALLNWPAPDASIEPMLLGIIDAMASELARAEAFDRNLLVIAPPRAANDLATAAELNQARESLGANLVLASSAAAESNQIRLTLRVLDPSSMTQLRQKDVLVPRAEQETLPGKAVQAAADLLGIGGFRPDGQSSTVGTKSPDAYAAFQAAESLRAQDNDTGLNAAIEKYKQAIDTDPGYAVAQARLAWAYLRSYGLHRDPGALTLARENCASAIRLDPDLVDAHVGLAAIYRRGGNSEAAAQEINKALALDPSNAHTLIYQADFYAEDNRWDDAKDTFKRVFKLRPNYWLAHNECGAVLEDEGDYSGALLEFQAASLAAPKNAFALKNVGSAYLDLGRIPEALKSLNASLNLSSDDKVAVALAEAFRVQHKFPDAIEYAQKAVKMNPADPGNWLELGDVSTSAGQSGGDADAAYRQAASAQQDKLVTSPKDGPGWMVLALCSAKNGEVDKALTLMAKAESFHADDMQSQLYKIRILELAGRRADALATVARCLGRGPTRFQIESIPDLGNLRKTSDFERIVASTTSPTA